MADENKVYYPEVIDTTPLPETVAETSQASGGSGGKDVVSSPVQLGQEFPLTNIAREVLSSSLNTKTSKILGSYSFGQVGALQIGKYVSGVSGDIRISPSGLVGRNASGNTTFAIDGETGDATFAGTLEAGVVVALGALVVGTNVDIGTAQDSAGVTTIIGNVVTTGYVNALSITAGSVSADDITAGTLTGSTIRTRATNSRVEVVANTSAINIYSNTGLVATIDENSDTLVIASFIGRDINIQADGEINITDGGMNFGGARSISGLYNLSFSGGGSITSDVYIASTKNLIFNGTQGSINCGDINCDNIDINGSTISEVNRVQGDSGYIDFNESGRVQVNQSFDPSSGSTYGLGGSSRYWQAIHTVSLTKYEGGSWGFFDKGVEMQDGKTLSDTEALLAMQENPDLLNYYGATTYKLDSLPKVMRVIPRNKETGEILEQDEDGEYFSIGRRSKTIKDKNGKYKKEYEEFKEIHKEGEDVFATISIMLGAIRELSVRVKALEQ